MALPGIGIHIEMLPTWFVVDMSINVTRSSVRAYVKYRPLQCSTRIPVLSRATETQLRRLFDRPVSTETGIPWIGVHGFQFCQQVIEPTVVGRGDDLIA